MVNNISWGSYWSVLTVLLTVYYAYVLLKYYRSDLRLRFQPALHITKKQCHDETGEAILPVVQSFSDEMTAYLEQASQTKAGKNEIIFALQQIAKKYSTIKDSTYQPAMNGLIVFEAKDKCAVHLSEEEIRQVWID